MLLTVSKLREEFGLEKECDFLFNSGYCQGRVQVFGTFNGGSLVFNFDNRIEYFEFLVEAKSLIENNIWRGLHFSSTSKRGLKTNKTLESDCLECGIVIDKRTQEILEQYVVKTKDDTLREVVLLRDTISKTKECLLNLEHMSKLM